MFGLTGKKVQRRVRLVDRRETTGEDEEDARKTMKESVEELKRRKRLFLLLLLLGARRVDAFVVGSVKQGDEVGRDEIISSRVSIDVLEILQRDEEGDAGEARSRG